MDSQDLLREVSQQYNLGPLEYAEQIRNPNTWGGGPELVALSNYFQRPIHVYELSTKGSFFRKSFAAKMFARFGSPVFDFKVPLRVLCADGRFPHIRPGQQKSPGDHFLALFPCPPSSSTVGRGRGGQLPAPPSICGKDRGLQWSIEDLEAEDREEHWQQELSWYQQKRRRWFDLPFTGALRWFGGTE